MGNNFIHFFWNGNHFLSKFDAWLDFAENHLHFFEDDVGGWMVGWLTGWWTRIPEPELRSVGGLIEFELNHKKQPTNKFSRFGK